MNRQFNCIRTLLPVMFGFFVMGMVDVVGVVTNFIRKDFFLNDVTASVIPMMIFLWFALVSIPSGILMSRIGKKNTVLIAIVIETIGLILPLFIYDLIAIIIAFAMLGIGNTILQVSLNPLTASIVNKEKLAGTLTLGQFIKAICSFLSPIIASVAVINFGNWKLIFVIYALISILSFIWLYLTSIPDHKALDSHQVTFTKVLSLLKNRSVFKLLLGIILIVGIDVCMNVYTPQLLIKKLNMKIEIASLGVSIYFGAKMLGAFLGSIILMKYNPEKFLKINMLFALTAFVFLILSFNQWILFISVAVIGFTCANVFSIIFSVALQSVTPSQVDEVSSLMIMGVAGGAVVTPLMGVLIDNFGISVGFGLLLICVIYVYTLSQNFSKYK